MLICLLAVMVYLLVAHSDPLRAHSISEPRCDLVLFDAAFASSFRGQLKCVFRLLFVFPSK